MDFRYMSEALVAFAEKHEDKWNELDGSQGDGDLGITIVLGAKALARTSQTVSHTKDWFILGGKEVRKSAPSTMGVLIASAMIAAGRSLEGEGEDFSPEDWFSIQQCMANEIQFRGGAKQGDKTVLDAFIPAIETFKVGVERGDSLQQILVDTAATAKQSAEETASLAPRTGRSSWLADRSRGNIDAGAWVCYQLYVFYRI